MYTTDLPTIKVTVLRDREAHTETADPSSRELTVIKQIAREPVWDQPRSSACG